MTLNGSTDSSLMARVQRRDQEAWSQFVELYAPLVAHWCRRNGLDSHDTADVLQDVFSAVAQRIETFDHRRPGSTFRGWLWTITRNRLCDLHRSGEQQMAPSPGGSTALRRLQHLADPSVPEEEPTTPADIRSLQRRAVAQVRAEFRSKTWQAFWRTTVDGVSTAEVAEELSMAPAAVRKARSRILRRLRQQLGED